MNMSDASSGPPPGEGPRPWSALYLQLLLEAAKDYAIFAMDRERHVTMWSAGAARIFGYRETEILGQTADVIFTPEDRAGGAPVAETQGALAHGRAEDERWHLRKNGDRFFASGVMTPLRDVDGGHLGFVKINRDLTERKLAEERLRASRDELAQRVEERTQELQTANASLRAEIARRAEAEATRTDLLRRIASAQEQERLRIAREMHDELGQHIAALMWRLNALELALTGSPHRPVVVEAQQLAEAIGREAHVLAVQLRPTALDDLGLPGAVATFVQVWSERSGVRVETQFVNLDTERLPRDVELTLYRIVQEALTNVLKHAQASRVDLVVVRNAREVALTVEDNGRGFAGDDLASGNDGLGLLGMRERVAAIGGHIAVESAPGAGTTLLVRVPLTLK